MEIIFVHHIKCCIRAREACAGIPCNEDRSYFPEFSIRVLASCRPAQKTQILRLDGSGGVGTDTRLDHQFTFIRF